MTTRRKPLPQNARVPEETWGNELSRRSTSGATFISYGSHQDHNAALSEHPSNDDYFDLLDSYHTPDTINHDQPPPYDEAAPVNALELEQTRRIILQRPQVESTHSTGFLSEDDITVPSIGPPSSTTNGLPDPAIGPSCSSTPLTRKSRPKLVTALEETSFYLGGLLSHPVESTKYFSILRHSHGLVYYKGPQTSLAISIFSSQPLPSSRRLWLQLKGWSGNVGMTTKALFRSNDSWVNVTPAVQVSAIDLQPLDERAWQRDIKKFIAKANKAQQRHTVRETAVVRIPFEASDGYFRIVLTGGESKSVLCPSPVFRVASTSMSASSLKGASLTTLPIELGVKAAQTAASVVLSKATAAAAPLKMLAEERVTNLAQLQEYGGYAQTAWDMSGMQNQVDTANEQYDARMNERPMLDRTASAPSNLIGNVIGNDSGPEAPFPVRLSGIVMKGTSKSTTAFETPTANLDNIPPDLISPMSTGVYFGWALVVTKDSTQVHLHDSWREAVITVSFTTASDAPRVAQRKTVRSYILHEYPPGTSFIGSKLKLAIMGYLRPPTPTTERDVFLLETVNDIAITRASLARPAWDHEQMLQRVQTAREQRGITDRLVDLRVAGQRKVDKIPVHMLGVRSDSIGMHDRGVYGNGGVWVKRD